MDTSRLHVRSGSLPIRLAGVCAALHLLTQAAGARAQAAPPAGHEENAFDFMNLLSAHGLHDIEEESWNAYGQFTYISSWKRPFSARYTNAGGSPNSLLPDAERSFSGTLTLFAGVGLWRGAAAYVAPEVVAQRTLSQLRGIGGSIQNFEMQKGGTETPQLYRSRTFLRQTVGLGGTQVQKVSDPLQLAGAVDSRRLVLTAGSFTILDVFDRNSVSWDPRQTFFNMAFMTYSSWDFPSDARGYSWGGTVELYVDDWALRIGRITPPQDPNQLATDFRLWKYYGDQFELEHNHFVLGQPGAVRFLAYRNHVKTGSFDDAVAAFQADPSKNATTCPGFSYDSPNSSAPDLCWVRKPTVKMGVGISIEQYVADGIGVFFRGMYSDGKSEVVAYNPADRSVALGAVAKGKMWNRPFDVAGLGVAASWISGEHARYLAMGGIDGFIGDGAIRRAPEALFEVFYSFNLARAAWLSADYQYLANPGFNADRGPVHILGGRAHAEF